MATASKTTSKTTTKTKAEVAARVQRIDPEKRYEALTEAPTFITKGGRSKSGLRLDIEALNVGEWINTERSGSADLANLRSLVQNVRKGFANDGVVAKFTVRTAAGGDIYVGRTV